MIRIACENDIPEIERLLSQVLTIHANGRPDIFKANTRKYSKEELSLLLKDKNSPIYLFINQENQVSGYIFCQYCSIENNNILQDKKYLYIDDLCVDKTARNTGVGHQLYDYAVAKAKQNGCDSVRLNVWNLNDGAMQFYQKLGMQPLKTTMEMKL